MHSENFLWKKCVRQYVPVKLCQLSQTGFCKNKQIWVFLGLTKENLSLLS